MCIVLSFRYESVKPVYSGRGQADQGIGQPDQLFEIGAVIDLGNCLNLIDADHLKFVAATHEAYINLCSVSGLKPLENKGQNLGASFLDRAVIETLHELRRRSGSKPFDSVRAFFVEGKPLYDTSGLRGLDHIQVCVRNSQNIVGYFSPRNFPPLAS